MNLQRELSKSRALLNEESIREDIPRVVRHFFSVFDRIHNNHVEKTKESFIDTELYACAFVRPQDSLVNHLESGFLFGCQDGPLSCLEVRVARLVRHQPFLGCPTEGYFGHGADRNGQSIGIPQLLEIWL